MPVLYLLRHAEAAPSLTGEDSARPLSEKGKAQATWLGSWFRQRAIQVTGILCSPAKRTRETLAALNVNVQADFPAELYLAEAHAMISLLSKSQTESVLLVGHNPGLHLLALELCGHEEGKTDALEFGFPAAGLAIFEVDSWQTLESAGARLQEFITPNVERA